MLTLDNDHLTFKFPKVNRNARLALSFVRTLRIPDDDQTYPLPAGLGQFPLSHVDDFADRVPPTWIRRGGVFLPMYQSEALWVSFWAGREGRFGQYPCAVKIAAGMINALTGEPWSEGLSASPQDYLIVPTQPWLDGFYVDKGVVRQFVAMPLGMGVTAEEQLTGEAKFGGLQVVAYPMSPKRYRSYLASLRRRASRSRSAFDAMPDALEDGAGREVMSEYSAEMGLAPGGRMLQEIYEDPFGIDAWDQSEPTRCFVHMLNSAQYRRVTGSPPPTEPITKEQYARYGIPWFEYYDDEAKALSGADRLAALQSVGQAGLLGGAS